MKCEKTGMYTILMDGKQWCPGCHSYHEPKLPNESDIIREIDYARKRSEGNYVRCTRADLVRF